MWSRCCGLATLAFLLTATAACRGPCTPSPPCQTPSHPLANAEAGEELSGHARWYTKVDSAGSKLVGPAPAPFVHQGADGTPRAARISGTFASRVDAFAVLGLELDRDAMATVDSRSIGFSFWAKSGIANGARVKARFSVTCENADSFAIDLPLYEAWAKYQIPFTALKPLPANRSATLDPERIRRFEWRSTEPANSFDLAVDELAATSCIERDVPSSCYAK